MLGAAGLPTRPPFAVGPQLSKPPENAPGFQMHSEDFPATPGSSTHKTSGERECVYAYVCLCFMFLSYTTESADISQDCSNNKMVVSSHVLYTAIASVPSTCNSIYKM